MMKQIRNFGLVLALTAFVALLVSPAMVQSQSGDQRNWGGTSTGTANVQVVAVANYRLAVGTTIAFVPGVSNTDSTTVNVNSTGAIVVKRSTNVGQANLVGGEFIANAGTVSLTYNGTNWLLNGRFDEVGQSREFYNNTFPAGYQIEDGSCISQTTYAALFTAISTTYGSCSAGLFKAPDTRGRATYALDNQGANGAASRLTSTWGCTATALNGTGCGLQSNALTSTNQFPPYTPAGSVSTPTGSVSTPTGTVASTFSNGLTSQTFQAQAFAGGAFNGWGSNNVSAIPVTGTVTSTFTGNAVTFTGNAATFTGSAVGASAGFAIVPPLQLVRRGIKL